MTSANILLLGGGYTLAKLATRLAKETFLITSRSDEKVAAYKQQGFLAEKLDVKDKQAVENFFKQHQSFDVVVDSIPPADLSGVKNIISNLDTYSLKRFIFLSTTGVYGKTDGQIVTEETKPEPQHKKAKARLEAENLYNQLNCEVSSLRIVGIYGPERNPVKYLEAGTYPLVDEGKRWSNRIHVDDLVTTIENAITYQGKLPKVINVSDGNFISTKEIITYLCEKYQLEYPQSISLEEAERRGMYTLLGNQRVSNQLLLDTFGMELRFPTIKDFDFK